MTIIFEKQIQASSRGVQPEKTLLRNKFTRPVAPLGERADSSWFKIVILFIWLFIYGIHNLLPMIYLEMRARRRIAEFALVERLNKDDKVYFYNFVPVYICNSESNPLCLFADRLGSDDWDLFVTHDVAAIRAPRLSGRTAITNWRSAGRPALPVVRAAHTVRCEHRHATLASTILHF